MAINASLLIGGNRAGGAAHHPVVHHPGLELEQVATLFRVIACRFQIFPGEGANGL
ncbi:hypothetical protein [Oceanithermus sp.]